MKRILTTLCALAFIMAGSIPALGPECQLLPHFRGRIYLRQSG